MSDALAGRRALITGATRGIGLAIAKCFLAAGARVCVNGPQADAELIETGHALGVSACAVPADLSKPAEVDRLATEAVRALGGIDILVLNAAVQHRQPWDQINREQFDHQMQVNLAAGYRLIQALTPAMVAQGWGRLIAIGSIQEVKEHPDMLIYAASKAAQASMIRNLARQLGASGVTCNCLSPGVIETERNRVVLNDRDYAEKIRGAIPMRRFGQPEDCADVALFLASDAARYVTGTTLFVDGGMHL